LTVGDGDGRDSDGTTTHGKVPISVPEPLPRETTVYEPAESTSADTEPVSSAQGAASGIVRSGETETFTLPSARYLALEGTVIADRYAVTHEIGRGGMGAVYAGHHESLDVPVAIKVMLPRYAADAMWLRRFQREAKATSRLSHRNVVRVIDYGEHDGMPYLVMEKLEGCSLADWLFDRPTPPTLAEIEPIMLGIFDAFEAAHASGIVHRDLKPDNVFLARESDGESIAKILDFGLAHMAEPGAESLTKDDMVSGTPEYMSPEQCRSLKVGPAADIYAIGCVLTEMLQLEPPFLGQTHVDVMTKQMFYEPPQLQRRPDSEPIPALLERLRIDLLAKRVSQRPATVAEARRRFVEALSPAAELDLLPGRKSAPPPGDRTQRSPSWDHPAPDRAPAAAAAGRVALWCAGEAGHGVDELCMMALASRGTRIVAVSEASAAATFPVVIIDAADGLDSAVEMATAIGDQARVVVCLGEVSSDAMGQLIAAGADVVMGYPIEPHKLERKVRRQLRRAGKR
jgi:eukaryotic-like serine/threonine-protein kinase